MKKKLFLRIMDKSYTLSLGIKCEVAHCQWLDGRPKLGHLQEAARNKRCFFLLANTCFLPSVEKNFNPLPLTSLYSITPNHIGMKHYEGYASNNKLAYC